MHIYFQHLEIIDESNSVPFSVVLIISCFLKQKEMYAA